MKEDYNLKAQSINERHESILSQIKAKREEDKLLRMIQIEETL
jgi:hypothetical protein